MWKPQDCLVNSAFAVSSLLGGLERVMATSSVSIRVPASTSNLGPGFDCLGMALQTYNMTTVKRVDQLRSHTAMINTTADAFFDRALGGKVKRFGFDVKIEGDIPVSRGLGSSVTVRLGVLMALAELAREFFSVSAEQILQLLIELEGHPDNAVASFLGGFAVSARDETAGGFSYTRVPVKPELFMVALIPNLKISTEAARALLPSEVSFPHAVENAQRAARIAAAFCTENYESLRGLFLDHLHQPFRQKLIPGFEEILNSATAAGALGSYLSGAGSTLIAPTLTQPEVVGAAMLETAQRHGLVASVRVLQGDNDGVQIVDES